MAKETTYAGKLGDWQRLLDSLTVNAPQLAHLEGTRSVLATQLAQALKVSQEQVANTATKQELSQQLRKLMVEGDRLATLLRSAVKQHFGVRAEKLTEFGVQPFRGRAPRKGDPGQVEAQKPAPPAAADPAR